MKLEQLKKIYTEQVAQYINDGWTIDPFIHAQECKTAVVFVRGNVRHVVYMWIQYRPEHFCHESVTVGSAVIGKLWSEDSFSMDECQEKRELVFFRIKSKVDWFINSEKFDEIWHKKSVRYSQKRRVGMFRVFMGKHESPSPEARRKALKLVRKVPGYGNTALKNIARIWFESGTDMTHPNWNYKPTLCVQILGRGSEARIPMPAYK